MNIEFKRLTEVEKSEIIELMNHPLVRRQMPLTSDNFSESDCDNFIAAGELEIGGERFIRYRLEKKAKVPFEESGDETAV